MNELIERLRNFEGSDELGNGDFSLLSEAAAALEAALERAERLAEALRGKASEGEAWGTDPDHPIAGCPQDERANEIFQRCANELRALLRASDHALSGDAQIVQLAGWLRHGVWSVVERWQATRDQLYNTFTTASGALDDLIAEYDAATPPPLARGHSPSTQHLEPT